MGKTEFDKIAKEKEMNIDEEMLNFVAGGIYTKEEWDAMTYEEKMEAWKVSIDNRAKNVYCQLD